MAVSSASGVIGDTADTILFGQALAIATASRTSQAPKWAAVSTGAPTTVSWYLRGRISRHIQTGFRFGGTENQSRFKRWPDFLDANRWALRVKMR